MYYDILRIIRESHKNKSPHLLKTRLNKVTKMFAFIPIMKQTSCQS